MQVAIAAINELAAEAGKPSWDWQAPAVNDALAAAVAAQAESDLTQAYRISDRRERYAKVGALRKAVVEALAGGDNAEFSTDEVAGTFGKLESSIVRNRILNGESRVSMVVIRARFVRLMLKSVCCLVPMVRLSSRAARRRRLLSQRSAPVVTHR